MSLGRSLVGALLVLDVAACSPDLAATARPTTSMAAPSPSSASTTPPPTATAVPGNALVSIAPLSEPRQQHSATLLADGRVLVVGGRFMSFDADHNVTSRTLSSVDIFDPTTDMWSPGPALHRARAQHTAIQLKDGRVLVVGGTETEDGQRSRTAELYDPATNEWSFMAGVPLEVTTAVLLEDGRIVAIGYLGSPVTKTSYAVFDSSDRSWGPVGIVTPLLDRVATVLDDGRVLAMGGFEASGGDGGPDPRAETALYDPKSGNWTEGPPMREPRIEPAFARLSDGRVLVVSNGSAEVFDPLTSTWTTTGAARSIRDATRLVVLPGDRVLAIGDSAGTIYAEPILEQYDVATGRWSTAMPFRVIQDLTATLLRDGRVLITGGRLECRFGQPCENQVVLADAQLLVPG